MRCTPGKNFRPEIFAMAGNEIRVLHLQDAQGWAFLEELSQVCVLRAGCGKALCAGLVTDSAHNTGNNFSDHYPSSALKTHSLHCYAKEKEKFTFEDKMVFLVKQSYCLCNCSFSGKVQLEPGTCCLQKYQVMGNNVKCSKWRWRH